MVFVDRGRCPKTSICDTLEFHQFAYFAAKSNVFQTKKYFNLWFNHLLTKILVARLHKKSDTMIKPHKEDNEIALLLKILAIFQKQPIAN